MTTSTTDALDLQSAADQLGVHYQTAYRWVRSGRLPARRVGGKYVVERSALDGVARERATPAAPPSPSESRLERSADRLHRLLIDGDEPAARRLVRRLVDEGTSVIDLVQSVLVPPLAQIGEAWHDGELSIWTEHRASAIVERLLGDIAPNPRGRRRGTAVVGSISGDHHSLPTTMAAVALRDDQWHVHHLGADVPVDELLVFCDVHGVDLVVITSTNPTTHSDARRAAERIEAAGFAALVGTPGSTLTDLVERARTTRVAAQRTSR